MLGNPRPIVHADCAEECFCDTAIAAFIIDNSY